LFYFEKKTVESVAFRLVRIVQKISEKSNLFKCKAASAGKWLPTPWSWRWKHYDQTKRQKMFTSQQNKASQTAGILSNDAVRNKNLESLRPVKCTLVIDYLTQSLLLEVPWP